MKLKVYLAERDMTLAEFSKMADVDPSYLSRVAKGKLIAGRKLARDISHLTNGQVIFETKKKEKK